MLKCVFLLTGTVSREMCHVQIAQVISRCIVIRRNIRQHGFVSPQHQKQVCQPMPFIPEILCSTRHITELDKFSHLRVGYVRHFSVSWILKYRMSSKNGKNEYIQRLCDNISALVFILCSISSSIHHFIVIRITSLLATFHIT